MSRIRTDECGKNFIAQLDFDLEGNHIIECPYCGHEHCRIIKGGKVTGERWNTHGRRIGVEKRHIWKSNVLSMSTSTAGEFIRSRWLNLVQSGFDGDTLENLQDLSGQVK